MIMEEPIPIKRPEPLITPEEAISLDKARNDRRLQWATLGILAFIVVGFLTPLFVWLTRLALGG
jgi:hypothetical protein